MPRKAAIRAAIIAEDSADSLPESGTELEPLLRSARTRSGSNSSIQRDATATVLNGSSPVSTISERRRSLRSASRSPAVDSKSARYETPTKKAALKRHGSTSLQVLQEESMESPKKQIKSKGKKLFIIREETIADVSAQEPKKLSLCVDGARECSETTITKSDEGIRSKKASESSSKTTSLNNGSPAATDVSNAALHQRMREHSLPHSKDVLSSLEPKISTGEPKETDELIMEGGVQLNEDYIDKIETQILTIESYDLTIKSSLIEADKSGTATDLEMNELTKCLDTASDLPIFEMVKISPKSSPKCTSSVSQSPIRRSPRLYSEAGSDNLESPAIKLENESSSPIIDKTSDIDSPKANNPIKENKFAERSSSEGNMEVKISPNSSPKCTSFMSQSPARRSPRLYSETRSDNLESPAIKLENESSSSIIDKTSDIDSPKANTPIKENKFAERPSSEGHVDVKISPNSSPKCTSFMSQSPTRRSPRFYSETRSDNLESSAIKLENESSSPIIDKTSETNSPKVNSPIKEYMFAENSSSEGNVEVKISPNSSPKCTSFMSQSPARRSPRLYSETRSDNLESPAIKLENESSSPIIDKTSETNSPKVNSPIKEYMFAENSSSEGNVEVKISPNSSPKCISLISQSPTRRSPRLYSETRSDNLESPAIKLENESSSPIIDKTSETNSPKVNSPIKEYMFAENSSSEGNVEVKISPNSSPKCTSFMSQSPARRSPRLYSETRSDNLESPAIKLENESSSPIIDKTSETNSPKVNSPIKEYMFAENSSSEGNVEVKISPNSSPKCISLISQSPTRRSPRLYSETRSDNLESPAIKLENESSSPIIDKTSETNSPKVNSPIKEYMFAENASSEGHVDVKISPNSSPKSTSFMSQSPTRRSPRFYSETRSDNLESPAIKLENESSSSIIDKTSDIDSPKANNPIKENKFAERSSSEGNMEFKISPNSSPKCTSFMSQSPTSRSPRLYSETRSDNLESPAIKLENYSILSKSSSRIIDETCDIDFPKMNTKDFHKESNKNDDEGKDLVAIDYEGLSSDHDESINKEPGLKVGAFALTENRDSTHFEYCSISDEGKVTEEYGSNSDTATDQMNHENRTSDAILTDVSAGASQHNKSTTKQVSVDYEYYLQTKGVVELQNIKIEPSISSDRQSSISEGEKQPFGKIMKKNHSITITSSSSSESDDECKLYRITLNEIAECNEDTLLSDIQSKLDQWLDDESVECLDNDSPSSSEDTHDEWEDEEVASASDEDFIDDGSVVELLIGNENKDHVDNDLVAIDYEGLPSDHHESIKKEPGLKFGDLALTCNRDYTHSVYCPNSDEGKGTEEYGSNPDIAATDQINYENLKSDAILTDVSDGASQRIKAKEVSIDNEDYLRTKGVVELQNILIEPSTSFARQSSVSEDKKQPFGNIMGKKQSITITSSSSSESGDGSLEWSDNDSPFSSKDTDDEWEDEDLASASDEDFINDSKVAEWLSVNENKDSFGNDDKEMVTKSKRMVLLRPVDELVVEEKKEVNLPDSVSKSKKFISSINVSENIRKDDFSQRISDIVDLFSARLSNKKGGIVNMHMSLDYEESSSNESINIPNVSLNTNAAKKSLKRESIESSASECDSSTLTSVTASKINNTEPQQQELQKPALFKKSKKPKKHNGTPIKSIDDDAFQSYGSSQDNSTELQTTLKPIAVCPLPDNTNSQLVRKAVTSKINAKYNRNASMPVPLYLNAEDHSQYCKPSTSHGGTDQWITSVLKRHVNPSKHNLKTPEKPF